MNTDEYVSVSEEPVTGLPEQLCSAVYHSPGVTVLCDLPASHEDRHSGHVTGSLVTVLWP